VLQIRPIELKAANAFVAQHHRHHKPVIGHRFSISAVDEFGIHGVAIVGRPVARGCDASTTLEVTRLCTDGTKNACSILYAAAARVGRELGYDKIQTYTLESEPGKSLVASGWFSEAVTAGGQWKHTAGPRRTDQPNCKKIRWARYLS
jgi:hypothetical protein